METKIKILILEHDPNDIGLLQYELRKSGLNHITEIVQTKADYENALSSIKFDVILSDYSLPAFDGLSAFRMKQNVAPETPFIIVSGTIGEENAVELIKMGVTDYALKEKMYQIAPKVQRALTEAAERKQKEAAELQLRQREEQLQKIMDLSLDIICTVDQDGRFVTINAASKLVMDYSPEELIGRRVVDMVHEEDKNRTLEAIANLQYGIDIINLESRFIRKSGALVTLLWSARWDSKDKLGYGVVKDITGIKKAEEKIRNSEKRFRTLLQNSVEAFSLIAADGTVIDKSPSSRKIFGTSASENSGSFRLDLIHPDDLSAAKEAFTKIKNNPNDIFTVEYRFLIDGSYKWLEITLYNQLEEPAVGAIVLNFRDITERKLAEIAIRESETRLKEAQAIGHIGSWELNLADGSTIWSDEMYHMYGVEKEDTKSTFQAFMSFIHPDDLPAVLDKIEKDGSFLEDDSINFRILRPNGEIRYVTVEARFEFDDKGTPVRLFGVQQDITEKKLAEIALEKSEEKYRNLFNLNPIPMWAYDVENFRLLDVNEAAIRHYGYNKDEFLSMTMKDILPKEDVGSFEELLINLRGTINVLYHDVRRHLKKNGEIIDVDIQCNSLDLGGREVRVVLATDVSERMHYIQAIEEQNEKLREIAWTQSHVIRAPLARIMGLANLLVTYSPEKVSITELLKSIQTSAHEMDIIIRDIVAKTDQVKNKSILEEQPER